MFSSHYLVTNWFVSVLSILNRGVPLHFVRYAVAQNNCVFPIIKTLQTAVCKALW